VRIAPIILIGTLLVLLPEAARAEQSIAAWEAEGKALEKETGIPRLRLPNNIPPQNSPTKELVHCTVGAAGRTDYVSIWLKRQDCDAWLKAAMEYNQKYGQELEQIKNRHLSEQNNADEAKRQQKAGPGRRIIYALFLCVPSAGTCQMQGESRVTFAGVMPATTFRSLAECEEHAKHASGLITPPTGGRFPLPGGGMWYECRGRQIDTWEAVH
jgi:hypothetical protein